MPAPVVVIVTAEVFRALTIVAALIVPEFALAVKVPEEFTVLLLAVEIVMS